MLFLAAAFALLQPQLTSSGKLVAVAYGSSNAIYVRTSRDAGQTFGQPVKVAEVPALLLHHHRGPRVAVSGNAIVVTAISSPAGDLLAWRSVDGGNTWSKGVRVNDVPAAAREGLHTLAADGQGKLFAAWLDLRQKGTRLYGAWSADSGATWSANVLLYESPDGSICQCCSPSAAFTSDGSLDVMFRNALAGSRDLYRIRANAAGQFAKAEKLGSGTWKLEACPMDGGGVAHDGARTVTVWRRGEEVFLEEPGHPEMRLGEGKDPAVAASRGKVYVLWVHGKELESWTEGKVRPLAESAAFPSLTPLPEGGVLAAWEQNETISFQRLP